MNTVTAVFTASYAAVALEVQSIRTDFSRRVDRYRPERGDGAETFDRGKVERVDSLDVILPGAPDQVRRAIEDLREIHESGAVRIFSHPVDGVWRARLGTLNLSIQPGSVSASMDLIQVTIPATSAQNTTDPSLETTTNDVAVEAEVADEALEAVGQEPAVSGAVAAATAWTELTPLSERLVLIEEAKSSLLDLRGQLRATSSTVVNLAAVQGITRTLGALQRLSDTIGQSGWRLVPVRVSTTTTLANFVGIVYGPEAIEEGARDILDQVQAANGLRDIMQIRPGVELQMPTRDSLGLPPRTI